MLTLLAVEHLSRRSNEYAIVISDLTMPFMSGCEFIKQVRAVYPKIVTFVITALDGINDINNDMSEVSSSKQSYIKKMLYMLNSLKKPYDIKSLV
jgi:DNA-binding NtrC family response regulator